MKIPEHFTKEPMWAEILVFRLGAMIVVGALLYYIFNRYMGYL